MSWDAGAITSSLKLDVNEYAHGMLQAEGLAHAFPPIVLEFLENPLLAFASIAKEAFHGVIEAMEGMAGKFHETGLAAANLGVSAEFISGVGAVAKVAGVGVEELGMSLKFLQQRGADALSGEQQAAKGFADIGIGAAELSKLLKEPEQLFYRVAQGISSIEEPAQRVQAATDLMSRAGYRMISLFSEGPDKIRSLARELTDLGGGVSTQEAEMGEKWGLLEAKFDAAWSGIKKALAEPILQFVTQNSEQLTHILRDTVEIIREIATLATPLLEIIGSGLRFILETTRSIFDGLRGIFGQATQEVAQGQSETSAAPAASGGGPSNAGVNIQQLTVGPIDANEASSQIAAKLQPAVRQAVLQQYKQLESAAQGRNVSSKLGAKGPTHYHSGL